jgi:lysozyme
MAATMQDLKAFIDGGVGQYFDPDGMYKFQCKDVIDALCLALWGDWIDTITPGNANQVQFTYSHDCFDWIPNVVGDTSNFPQFGDIVCFGGDKDNDAGHIALVIRADYYSMYVLQQNVDGQAMSPASAGILGYDQPGTGPCTGWLRPKVSGRSVVPVPTQPPLPSATALNVIDISNHQAGISIRSTGAQAVVMKATEGVGWQDPQLKTHTANVRDAGVRAGFYHFARLGEQDGNTPEAEAQTFIDAVKPLYRKGDKLYLDWEAGTMNLGRGDLARRWLDIVSAEFGTTAVFYTYLNVLTTHEAGLEPVRAGGYSLWLAVYPSTAPQSWGPVNAMPTPDGWHVEMWQYSSSGRLPGYSGPLDLNLFYGTEADWVNGSLAHEVVVPVLNGPTVTPAQCIVSVGDTLSKIAAQYGVSVDGLLHVNPSLRSNPDLIYPGQVLNVPSGTVNSRPVDTNLIKVEAGDTLFGIAVQFGVNLDDLIAVNGISNANLIYPGQLLTLPGRAAPPVHPPSGAVTECTVDDGDTMASIAAQFGLTLPELIAKNPQIANPDYIQAGWVLNV